MTANAIETAEEKAREGADKAISETRETAKNAGAQARSTISKQADQQSTQAGERVKSFAGDFKSTAEELRKQGKDQPAKVIDQVADRAEEIGDYLERTDGQQMLDDIERFGRRRPWAIAAAGFAIGLTASRLLKASSADRYDRSFGQTRPSGSTPRRDLLTSRQFDGQTETERVAHEQVLAGSGTPAMGG